MFDKITLLLRFVGLLGCLLWTASGLMAQNGIHVTSFQRMETDITARVTAPERDQNGEVCALLRIVTTDMDFMFEPDALGVVSRKNKTGEIWLYIPRGARRISIMHPRYGVLRNYFYPDIIESATVYELVLGAGENGVSLPFMPQYESQLCTLTLESWLTELG